MNTKKPIMLFSSMIFIAILFCTGCRTPQAEMASLMKAIDVYETAWAEGGFLKLDVDLWLTLEGPMKEMETKK